MVRDGRESFDASRYWVVMTNDQVILPSTQQLAVSTAALCEVSALSVASQLHGAETELLQCVRRLRNHPRVWKQGWALSMGNRAGGLMDLCYMRSP